jgi:hypothetical protein
VNKRWILIVMLLWFVMSPGLADSSGNPEQPSYQLLVMLHMPLPHFRPGSSYSGRYTDDASHSARRRIASDIAQQHKLKLVSDWPMPTLGVDCYLMEAHEPVEKIMDMLSHDNRVEWVQVMAVYHALGNDEAKDALYPLQPSARFWHLSELHQVATGSGVRVAIIDSGVDDNHPELAGQVKLKENFIDNNPYASESHGTAVAGIIAAKADNGRGVVGIAPNANLMALRACWQISEHDTQCNSFTLGKALNFAILHKAQVINMSLTGPPDRLLQMLLDAALAQGITIVSAVDLHHADGGFPASYHGVLAISEEDFNVSRAGVLMAPGRDIPTTAPGGSWQFVSGASFACAHASGLVALLLELKPALTNVTMKQKIVQNSTSSDRPGGAIDACATIALLTGSCVCSCHSNYAAKAIH